MLGEPDYRIKWAVCGLQATLCPPRIETFFLYHACFFDTPEMLLVVMWSSAYLIYLIFFLNEMNKIQLFLNRSIWPATQHESWGSADVLWNVQSLAVGLSLLS